MGNRSTIDLEMVSQFVKMVDRCTIYVYSVIHATQNDLPFVGNDNPATGHCRSVMSDTTARTGYEMRNC